MGICGGHFLGHFLVVGICGTGDGLGPRFVMERLWIQSSESGSEENVFLAFTADSCSAGIVNKSWKSRTKSPRKVFTSKEKTLCNRN